MSENRHKSLHGSKGLKFRTGLERMLLLMEFRLPLLHPFSFDKVDARKEEGAGVFKKSPSFSPIAFSPSSAPHLPSS